MQGHSLEMPIAIGLQDPQPNAGDDCHTQPAYSQSNDGDCYKPLRS